MAEPRNIDSKSQIWIATCQSLQLLSPRPWNCMIRIAQFWIADLARKLQSRLKSSILTFGIPPPPPKKKGRGWPGWNWLSRLYISIPEKEIFLFWDVPIVGPSGSRFIARSAGKQKRPYFWIVATDLSGDLALKTSRDFGEFSVVSVSQESNSKNRAKFPKFRALSFCKLSDPTSLPSFPSFCVCPTRKAKAVVPSHLNPWFHESPVTLAQAQRVPFYPDLPKMACQNKKMFVRLKFFHFVGFEAIILTWYSLIGPDSLFS